jgi:rhodanese-related sulfurtransferase
MHNVSRIAHLKNGKEGLKSCVVDLFGCRSRPRPDDSIIDESEEKSLPFSRISEEKCEESPSQHFSSAKQEAFKIQPRAFRHGNSSGMRVYDSQQNSDARAN